MFRLIYGILIVLLIWISIDLFYPKKSNLSEFDPKETAKLDMEMWRSYYEKKPLKLYFQSAKLMRSQLKAPFWRSYFIAFHAAKAAFIFKGGQNRVDYAKSLPNLEKYYRHVLYLSDKDFNVKIASQNELEWWIIRREMDKHKPTEWAVLQAKVASEIYQKPDSLFYEYGQLRTLAMFYRDQKGENINESDWLKINNTLVLAWKSLHKKINKK